MQLTSYRTLGRSGLVVSPLALGTMTFGADRWGTDTDRSRAVFQAYVEAGGNFVDTADIYAAGHSEEMIGAFVADTGTRDLLVIASKFGWPAAPDALSGGNSAKNIRLALDGSLARLRTDYLDLYWMHVWDHTTPAEEVLRALTDAVQAGKILHYGFSNAPGWYVAKIATLAQAHGLPTPIGLQHGYSVSDRGIELDIVPAGRALGLGLVTWSPLAAGLLTGKYSRDLLARADQPIVMPQYSASQQSADEPTGESDGRLNGGNPTGGLVLTERNFDIVDVVRSVADELGRPMAQVALAWVTQRAGVSSVLIGASRAEQVKQNVAALDIVFTDHQQARLDAAGAVEPFNPYTLYDLPAEAVYGGSVEPWKGL